MEKRFRLLRNPSSLTDDRVPSSNTTLIKMAEDAGWLAKCRSRWIAILALCSDVKITMEEEYFLQTLSQCNTNLMARGVECFLLLRLKACGGKRRSGRGCRHLGR